MKYFLIFFTLTISLPALAQKLVSELVIYKRTRNRLARNTKLFTNICLRI